MLTDEANRVDEKFYLVETLIKKMTIEQKEAMFNLQTE